MRTQKTYCYHHADKLLQMKTDNLVKPIIV